MVYMSSYKYMNLLSYLKGVRREEDKKNSVYLEADSLYNIENTDNFVLFMSMSSSSCGSETNSIIVMWSKHVSHCYYFYPVILRLFFLFFLSLNTILRYRFNI